MLVRRNGIISEHHPERISEYLRYINVINFIVQKMTIREISWYLRIPIPMTRWRYSHIQPLTTTRTTIIAGTGPLIRIAQCEYRLGVYYYHNDKTSGLKSLSFIFGDSTTNLIQSAMIIC